MGKVTSFEDLLVWQGARKVGLQVYRLTKNFPKEEMFGLTSQFRRAAISVSSNIAEGFGRYQTKDKEHFYVIALGSLSEVLSQAIISRDLGYMSDKDLDTLRESISETRKMLIALIKTHRS